jgi:hypothetical protein
METSFKSSRVYQPRFELTTYQIRSRHIYLYPNVALSIQNVVPRARDLTRMAQSAPAFIITHYVTANLADLRCVMNILFIREHILNCSVTVVCASMTHFHVSARDWIRVPSFLGLWDCSTFQSSLRPYNVLLDLTASHFWFRSCPNPRPLFQRPIFFPLDLPIYLQSVDIQSSGE